MSLRVLIADDHAIVRKGLRDILHETAEPVIVGEASDGQEVLNKVHTEHWDVVILDISLPSTNGIDVLKTLKQEQPNLPVLMFSMHSDEQYVQGSLNAGASGYLSKESAPEELVAAIRAILSGKRYLSRSIIKRLNLDL